MSEFGWAGLGWQVSEMAGVGNGFCRKRPVSDLASF